VICAECERHFPGDRIYCSRKCAGAAVGKRGAARRAERNSRYNGGLCFYEGRLMVCCRDGSVMWFSRAVMAAETKRLLRPDEIVHHINGDGSDDRPENLTILTRSEHINLHRDDLLAGRRKAAS
jgi:hypothetical protein